jgi:hypothetical protein
MSVVVLIIRNSGPPSSSPLVPWSKERAIGSGVDVGQDGTTTTTPTKHKREKSCSLLRELPALAEFLEAKAHMAHAASLHQPTRKRHTHRRFAGGIQAVS